MEFFLLIAALFVAYGLPDVLQGYAQRYRYARAQKRGYINRSHSS